MTSLDSGDIHLLNRWLGGSAYGSRAEARPKRGRTSQPGLPVQEGRGRACAAQVQPPARASGVAGVSLGISVVLF